MERQRYYPWINAAFTGAKSYDEVEFGQVVVKKLPDGYQAHGKDNPKLWEAGKTPEEAYSKLRTSQPDLFPIDQVSVRPKILEGLYIARYLEKPELWAKGLTPEEAYQNLQNTHPELFRDEGVR